MLSEKIRLLARQRKEQELIKGENKDLSIKDPFFLKVWMYIRKGHKPNLRGASDLELQEAFPKVNGNTVRLTRFKLEKDGYIKKTGGKRSIKYGGKKVFIYEVTDKWQGPECSEGIRIDEKTILLTGD